LTSPTRTQQKGLAWAKSGSSPDALKDTNQESGNSGNTFRISDFQLSVFPACHSPDKPMRTFSGGYPTLFIRGFRWWARQRVSRTGGVI
jgi:hypothetical protein